VGGAILVQFRIAQVKMTLERVIFGRRELAVQFVGADVWRVLVSDAAGIERGVVNRYRVFARFCFALSNRKSVLTDERLCLETDELDDDVLAHEVSEFEFFNAKREKAGRCWPVRPFV
jgi:hypothetical protein